MTPLDTTDRLPWVRLRRRLGDEPITAANVYHAVLFEEPNGKVTAECGRSFPGPMETVVKAPGHWPDAYSCRDCIARVKRAGI